MSVELEANAAINGLPKVVIVGAGFSGTALAIQLLRRSPHPFQLTLVERSGRFARGVAYGTSSPEHFLNVPVGRMSVFPDRPDDFLVYLGQRGIPLHGGDFAPRVLYGEYLQARLQESVEAAPGCGFTALSGEVRTVVEAETGFRLRLADGSALDAARVIMTIGNGEPAIPDVLRAIGHAPNYLADPWQSGALDRVEPDSKVLLLGTGLTMFDVALYLSRRDCGPLIALSRRGLVPQSHREHVHWEARDMPVPGLCEASELRAYVRCMRQAIRACAAEDIDWRDVLTSIRQQTPALWQRLATNDQARFYRHLGPYWDTHRHRCAPQVGLAIEQLRAATQLSIKAGRIRRITLADQGFRVIVQERGTGCESALDVTHIVNCTGPGSRLSSNRDGLLQDLLASGLAEADALDLGLTTDAAYGLSGTGDQRLYYLGPWLKGQYLESTAVPELREHAVRLADIVLQSLFETSGLPAPEGVSIESDRRR